MKNFEKMFEEMTKSLVNETTQKQSDVISEQIDAFEQRMSKMIDDKLSSLGQNNKGKGEDTDDTPPDSIGDSTDGDTDGDTDRDTDDTAN